jgi:3-oxoacyl-[acyl-carrier protein] reductase
MGFDFKGKRVVVAGGSRGIGRSIALGFAAAGAQVSICARGADALAATRADIARHGGLAHAAPCDLADAADVARYVAEAQAALGGIDVLVNNASGFGMGDDEAGWAASLQVDVMAMVRASHAALPALLANAATGSCIVHLTSISGLRPSARSAAYAAAKAAMISYTGSQAAMLARQGVRVNAIAPGSIEFPGGVWDQRRLAGDPLYERTLKSIPFGRMGTAEEIAEVALFLASPHARWITGQTIAVDGGQLLGV